MLLLLRQGTAPHCCSNAIAGCSDIAICSVVVLGQSPAVSQFFGDKLAHSLSCGLCGRTASSSLVHPTVPFSKLVAGEHCTFSAATSVSCTTILRALVSDGILSSEFESALLDLIGDLTVVPKLGEVSAVQCSLQANWDIECFCRPSSLSTLLDSVILLLHSGNGSTVEQLAL